MVGTRHKTGGNDLLTLPDVKVKGQAINRSVRSRVLGLCDIGNNLTVLLRRRYQVTQAVGMLSESCISKGLFRKT
jgi:hypothetical protein